MIRPCRARPGARPHPGHGSAGRTRTAEAAECRAPGILTGRVERAVPLVCVGGGGGRGIPAAMAGHGVPWMTSRIVRCFGHGADVRAALPHVVPWCRGPWMTLARHSMFRPPGRRVACRADGRGHLRPESGWRPVSAGCGGGGARNRRCRLAAAAGRGWLRRRGCFSMSRSDIFCPSNVPAREPSPVWYRPSPAAADLKKSVTVTGASDSDSVTLPAHRRTSIRLGWISCAGDAQDRRLRHTSKVTRILLVTAAYSPTSQSESGTVLVTAVVTVAF